MLISLSIKNFMQHEDLDLEFTEGLNAIRGANEAGKSSIFWAIQYALYGIRALPGSLEDTVTWGKPDSSLKVRLKFEHQGSEYLITRGKSGAELQGPGFLSSGAAEVTAKIEELFGARQDIARAVMISNQDDIRRGLGEGNMDLIESLSDTSLIDTLIKKVQANLPTGNTSLLDNEIARLSESPRPLLNIDDDSKEIVYLEHEATKASAELKVASDVLDTLVGEAAVAQDLLNRYENSAALQAKNNAEIESLRSKTYTVPTWEGHSEDELESLIAHKREMGLLAAEKSRFDTASLLLAKHTVNIRKDAEELATSIEENKAQLNEWLFRERHLKGHLNVEGVCNVCGSILEDQEALEKRKAEARQELGILEPKIRNLQTVVAKLSNELKVHNEALQAAKTVVAGLEGNQHVSVVWSDGVPSVSWVSGEVVVPTEDYEKQLKQLRAVNAEIARVETEKLRDSSRLAALLSSTSEVFDAATLEKARSVIRAMQTAQSEVSLLKQEASKLSNLLSTKKHQLELRVQSHQMEVKAWEKDQARLEELKRQLAATLAHNSLIKKLRDARPVVVNKLWSLLLHLISQSFSEIRGVQSVVARGEKGFTIDGKSYKLYSGSTIDSLGLAVREAMQKVFLGTVDFTMVDEAAKGMDATRHTNMLAQLSRSGFKQVLVITHSDLVDSYAANLIQL